MKTNYLFPNRFKKIGWVLLIPSLIIGVLWIFFQFETKLLNVHVFAIISVPFFGDSEYFTIIENNILDELLAIFLTGGSLLVAFSKEKKEDEFISKIRIESLVWATYVNYAILLLALFTVYGISFYWVMIFNIFTVLLFFIARFNYMIYKSKKSLENEE